MMFSLAVEARGACCEHPFNASHGYSRTQPDGYGVEILEIAGR
jgi:hypothetical protein